MSDVPIVGDVVDFFSGAFEKVIGWFIDVPETSEQKTRGWEIEKQGTNQPIPIIYGRRRIAPINVFKEVEGVDNKHLWKVGVLCVGPVYQLGATLGDIYIDDVPLSDSRWDNKVKIFHDNVLTVDNTSTDWIRLYFYTYQQPGIYCEALENVSSNWDSTKTFDKLGYVVMRYRYNPDLFSGEPQLKVVAKGKLTADLTINQYGEEWYTDNPANHTYDYLTDTIDGKGLSQSDINLTAFKTAALKCRTLAAQYIGGSSDLIFRSNIIIDTAEKLFDNTKELLANFRALFSFVSGKYSAKVEDDEQPIVDLTRNELIDNQLSYKGEDKSQRYNRVIVKFVDPDQNWQTNEVAWPDYGSDEEEALLIEDNQETLEYSVDIPSIANKYQAREWARIICLTSRKNMIVEGRFTAEAIEASAGDLITLDVSEEAAVFSAYPSNFVDADFASDIYYSDSRGGFSKTYKVPYRVMRSKVNPDGTVNLTLREHQPSIYPWISDAEIPTFGELSLPDPYSDLSAVTGLSISEDLELSANGDVNSFIDASWTEATSGFVDLYEIRWRKSGSSDNYQYAQARNTTTRLYGVRVGTTYEVSVRGVIESLNIRQDWSSTQTLLIDGDNGAPDAPTSITATSSRYSIAMGWTNDDDADLDAVEIHIKTANVTPTDDTDLHDTVKAKPGKDQAFNISLGDFAEDTTYYIFLRSVDRSGNESSFASSVSGQFEIPWRGHIWRSAESYDRGEPDVVGQTEYGFDMKPDGTKAIFVLGSGVDNIRLASFSMSTAYTPSTGAESAVTTVSTSFGIPYPSGRDVHAKPAGDKLIVLLNSKVAELDLSTDWDETTATLANTLDISAQTTTAQSLAMNDAGDVAFILDGAGVIYQYSLSTAWDVSTMSYDSKSYTPTNAPDCIEWVSASRMMMFRYDGSSGVSRMIGEEHYLSTDDDIATAALSVDQEVGTDVWGNDVGYVRFVGGGRRMFVFDGAGVSTNYLTASMSGYVTPEVF